jgi:hypothetical protein
MSPVTLWFGCGAFVADTGFLAFPFHCRDPSYSRVCRIGTERNSELSYMNFHFWIPKHISEYKVCTVGAVNTTLVP